MEPAGSGPLKDQQLITQVDSSTNEAAVRRDTCLPAAPLLEALPPLQSVPLPTGHVLYCTSYCVRVHAAEPEGEKNVANLEDLELGIQSAAI